MTLLLNTSCGNIKIKGGTDNTVNGEVKQKIIIDIPMCDELPPKDKLDCIKTFVDLFKTLSKETCEVNPDGSLPDTEACQKIIDALNKQ
jgi:hypothetical protein